MRIIFGILSLLIVVAVVGTLAKKQLTGISATSVNSQDASQVVLPTATPGATVQQQSQQAQQQVKQSLEASLQQARPTGDEQ